ncbi:unnamed protein product [Spirodela intermedia]|uniref:Uncharacterized protein n=1 Tax=Spirodela intermedia TaxID=51605 RepID=A0A7I8K324_SPIIN|nr:unnamed protein product [Spirodela intermedia]
MDWSDRAPLWLLLSSSWLLLLGYCTGQSAQGPHGSFRVSSFSFPDRKLGPYEWSYARVELPPWFSSMTMRFISNVDLDSDKVNKLPKSEMPIMCFRHSGPPLPDVSDTSLTYLHMLLNISLFSSVKILQSVDWCLPFQRNITVTFTSELMSPGIWYVGYFNRLGLVRTQSKMVYLLLNGYSTITRGHIYIFSTTLSIEGCSMSTIWGSYCNQTITSLFCNLLTFIGIQEKNWIRLTFEEKNKASYLDQLINDEKFMLCNDSMEAQCLGYGDIKFYSLDVVDPTSQFKIIVEKVKHVGTTLLNKSMNAGRILLLDYARYNVMQNKEFYDFSTIISDTHLVVQLSKISRWYLRVRVVNKIEVNGEFQESYFNTSLCFCPLEKKFHLEPLLSNYTINARTSITWTYFLLEIPQGATRSNLHIQLVSKKKMDYKIFIKFGGMPSDDNWDHYANITDGGNGSMMLLSKNNEDMIDFYILYAREGLWGFRIKKNSYKKSCQRSCSSHGSYHSSMDETRFSSYSSSTNFCQCDHDHGGFDCSNKLVSHQGHVWQSIFLIASNVAAIFPTFWALRQKKNNYFYDVRTNFILFTHALAEWLLFTASGISSGLYHACDVGTWCALSFHILQFMDFWLSFMAAVSTFVSLASTGEASKRTIQMCVSIVTALLAATGATSSDIGSVNIIIVIAIGTVGLLFGWILKLPKHRIGISSLRGCGLSIQERWQSSGPLLSNLLQALRRRFHWSFLLMGFLLLGAAGGSWMLENHESYLIWHSLWHVTIYTSSFFFLCSVRSSDGD